MIAHACPKEFRPHTDADVTGYQPTSHDDINYSQAPLPLGFWELAAGHEARHVFLEYMGDRIYRLAWLDDEGKACLEPPDMEGITTGTIPELLAAYIAFKITGEFPPFSDGDVQS